MPPPMPVIAPRMMESTTPRRCVSAVAAPVTQNSARPAASSASIGRCRRLIAGCATAVRSPAPAATARYRQSRKVCGGMPISTSRMVPAGDPHHHGEHDRAEQVELLPHAGHAAAQAEHERSDQVEDKQQGRAEPGQQGRGGHRGVRRGYSASQAQVAATSVSTPVSSVGWMTGANFGLWLVGISLSLPSRSAFA